MSRKRYITVDQVRQMHAMAAQNVSRSTIAKALGVNRQAVYHHLNEGKLLDRPDPGRFVCIAWRAVTLTDPAPGRDVLLAVRGEPEAAEGFRLGDSAEAFVYSTGHDVPAGSVYAWAPLPACPPAPQEGAAP